MAARTRDELLDLWRRVLDPSFVASIEESGYGFGFEVYEAHATMVARASLAVERSCQGMYVLPHSGQTEEPAGGPARSVVSLSVARTGQYQHRVVFVADLQVEDSSGRRFAIGTDTALAAGAPGPLAVAATAVRPGWGYDVAADTLVLFVQQGAEFANVGASVALPLGIEEVTDTGRPDCYFPGHVGQYVQFTAGANLGEVRRVLSWRRNANETNTLVLQNDDGGPALVAEVGTAAWRFLRWGDDLLISVTNPAVAAGGRAGMLDMLGRERGIQRRDGEVDASYRLRVSTLPDTVSPNAIRRAGNRVLAPIGERVVLREVGYAGLPGFFWDLDAWDYDDVVRPADRFKFWLNSVEMRGFFKVGVPERTDGEFGFFYDGGFVDAYDASPALDFWDGYPAVYWHRYVAPLHDQINAIKGAGVGFLVYRVKPDDPPESTP